MKITLALLLMSLAQIVFANGRCEEKAKELVSNLESVLVELEGVPQGDYDEEQLNTKLVRSSKKSSTYRIVADHTNEDNEGWANTYEVTLEKEFCSIRTYRFLGSK